MANIRRPQIYSWAVLGLVLLAAGLISSACAPAAASVQQSAPYTRPAANFTLLDQDGNTVTMQSLRGKAVVMDFIYTNCPPGEECPILTGKMAALQRSLKSAGLASRVTLLSITFDPEHDTPQVLKDYASRFNADLSNWHFLRGDDAQTQAVAKAYGIYYKKDKDGSFEHTALIMVIDPQGTIRFWEPPTGGHDLLQDVRQVLQ